MESRRRASLSQPFHRLVSWHRTSAYSSEPRWTLTCTDGRDRTGTGTTEQMELPPAGPRAQGWTGRCKGGHGPCLAEVGMHPLAIGQDRPSRLGPAGEARYPEGGRRREDEPPGKGGAAAPVPEGDDHQDTEQLENWLHPGARHPRTPLSMGTPIASLPPPCCPRGTRQDLPCTSAGEPRPPEFDPSRRVSPRCPRPAINSQRSPPAATFEHEASAGFGPASSAREHPRNA